MRRVILFVLLLWPIFGAASSVSAQQAPEQPGRGDGGLHVSNGGMVGYVGGSGSISGTVRGPGGSGGAAPSRAATTDPGPSAVEGGKVEPASVRDVAEADAAPTSSRTVPYVVAGVAAAAGAAIFAFRRRKPLLT